MSPKQQRFVEEYTVDWNGGQAAIRAGYSPKTAEQQASRLLKNVKVRQAVEARRQQITEQIDYDLERWFRAGVDLAESDVRKLFDPQTGRVLEPWEWDDATAQSVSSIEVEEIHEGTPDARTVIGHKKKIRFWDKMKARDQLAKHMGAYEADNRQRMPDYGYANMSVEQLRRLREQMIGQGVTIEGQCREDK